MDGLAPGEFRRSLTVMGREVAYFSLAAAEARLGDLDGLPRSLRVLLEDLLARAGESGVGADDLEAVAGYPRPAARDRVPARTRADAGLHRRAGHRRSGGDARRHGGAGRRPRADQPAGPGGPGDRPLRHRRRLRRGGRVRPQRRHRDAAQPRALRLPAVGTAGVRQLPRGPARDRHLPSGEPGASGIRGADRRARRGVDGPPRHAGGHRQPYHDDQRPGGAGLGRRRDRGRGGDAGPAAVDAGPRGRGRRADRTAARGDYGHRSGAYGDGAPAPPRGGGQVRRVFRGRRGRAAARRPRHHR